MKMKNVKDNKMNKKTVNNKPIRRSNKRKKIHVHSRGYYVAKRIIVCLVTFLIIIILGMLLAEEAIFKISDIEVDGESEYSYDEIVKSSGISYGDNLFICDIDKAKNGIESTLPYIDKVEICRNIPNKIIIKVEDSQPKFAMEYDGKYIIISDSGKIFEFKDVMPDNVVELKGVELKSYDLCDKMDYVDPIVKEKTEEIIEIMNKNQLNITKIDISDIYNICIKYDNRIDLLLGVPDEIDYKMSAAKEILCNKLKNDERGKLDLSNLKVDGRSYFTPEYITK